MSECDGHFFSPSNGGEVSFYSVPQNRTCVCGCSKLTTAVHILIWDLLEVLSLLFHVVGLLVGLHKGCPVAHKVYSFSFSCFEL